MKKIVSNQRGSKRFQGDRRGWKGIKEDGTSSKKIVKVWIILKNLKMKIKKKSEKGAKCLIRTYRRLKYVEKYWTGLKNIKGDQKSSMGWKKMENSLKKIVKGCIILKNLKEDQRRAMKVQEI